MSQPSDREARAYLSECFGHDPATEAGTILALRRRRRRARNLDADLAAPPPLKRDRIEHALAELRRAFFTLPPQALREQLEALDVGGHPDLERHIQRLHRMLACRADLDAAYADARIDDSFLDLVCRMAIAPRREAGARHRNRSPSF